MSSTMAVYMRYNSQYISLPSSAKQQCKMTKFALSEEHEPQRLIFTIYISNFMLCSIFSFKIVLTRRKK